MPAAEVDHGAGRGGHPDHEVARGGRRLHGHPAEEVQGGDLHDAPAHPQQGRHEAGAQGRGQGRGQAAHRIAHRAPGRRVMVSPVEQAASGGDDVPGAGMAAPPKRDAHPEEQSGEERQQGPFRQELGQQGPGQGARDRGRLQDHAQPDVGEALLRVARAAGAGGSDDRHQARGHGRVHRHAEDQDQGRDEEDSAAQTEQGSHQAAGRARGEQADRPQKGLSHGPPRAGPPDVPGTPTARRGRPPRPGGRARPRSAEPGVPAAGPRTGSRAGG